MKKYIAALFTALLLLCTALSAGAVGPALTTTKAYCIIDADTGLVLAQQNMNEELHPASITKVMTLGLACQKAQGNWDGVKLTVSHEDVYSLAGTDSSHIALQEGGGSPPAGRSLRNHDRQCQRRREPAGRILRRRHHRGRRGRDECPSAGAGPPAHPLRQPPRHQRR